MSDIAPDLVEYIVGFRQWTLELRDPADMDAGGWLMSNHSGERWEPEMVAECRAHIDPITLFENVKVESHSPPGSVCGCGLYAHHRMLVGDLRWYRRTIAADLVVEPSLTIAPGLAGEERRPFTCITPIVGAIAAWGDVEVHRGGFRAKRAKVVALALAAPECDPELVAGPERVLRATARHYGAEVVKLEDLPAAAERYGKAVPAELLPEEPKAPSGSSYHYMGGGYVTQAPPLTFSWAQGIEHEPRHPEWGYLAIMASIATVGWILYAVFGEAVGFITGCASGVFIGSLIIEAVFTFLERRKRSPTDD